MQSCRIAAPAKLNLYLEVTDRDSMGYHQLETIFCTIDLHDSLVLHRIDHVETGQDDEGGQLIQLTCDDPDLPSDQSNLAWQAAQAYLTLRPQFGGIHIAITKRIPAGGGLGGGSSDAAAVLRGMAQLDQQPPSLDQLEHIARQLGADIAFFLHGGCAYASGRGDIIKPLPDLDDTPLITLILPDLHCSTPDVFKALSDQERGPRPLQGFEFWSQKLQDLHPADLANILHNRLTAPAERRYPSLTKVFTACTTSKHPWLMSGSGATVFVLGEIPAPVDCQALSTRFRPRSQLDAVTMDDE